MDSQAPYLDEDDNRFIGINHLDAETKPDKTIAKEFLSNLTSHLHKKFQKK